MAFAAGCATGFEQHRAVAQLYHAGAYEDAFDDADDLLEDALQLNRALYALESGMAALAAGQSAEARARFRVAEKRYLKISGTLAIDEVTGSYLLDDNTREYEAEPHERLMLAGLLMLTWLVEDDWDSARVERNRSVNRLLELVERAGGRARAAYDNPWLRYLVAMIYDWDGDSDDAALEYRRIIEAGQGGKGIKAALARAQAGRKPAEGGVVIVTLRGEAPRKRARSLTVPTSAGITRITYPQMRRRSGVLPPLKLRVGEHEALPMVRYDISRAALAQFARQEGKIRARAIARATAKTAAQVVGRELIEAKKGKKESDEAAAARMAIGCCLWGGGAVASAAEQADRRSWMTLAATAEVYALDGLAPGDYEVEVPGVPRELPLVLPVKRGRPTVRVLVSPR